MLDCQEEQGVANNVALIERQRHLCLSDDGFQTNMLRIQLLAEFVNQSLDALGCICHFESQMTGRNASERNLPPVALVSQPEQVLIVRMSSNQLSELRSLSK